MNAAAQRIAAVVFLLAAGLVFLPLAAAVLDDGSSGGGRIVLGFLVLMAVGGAIAALALPALLRPSAAPSTRVLIGLAWGLCAGLLSLMLFWIALGGSVAA